MARDSAISISVSSSNAFNLTHPANSVLSITSAITGSIGLPGNLCLLILIGSQYRSRKPYEWLLFTLALGDFGLCFNNAVLEAYFVTRFNRIECKIIGPIDYILGNLSFLTPPLVAYNRYLSLYNEQRCNSLFTNRNVFIMWAVELTVVFCWVSPWVITGSLGQDDVGLCGIQMRTSLLGAFMAVDLGVVSVSYVCVMRFSYKVVLKIKSHKKAGEGQNRLQSRLINESKEIITTMLIISAIPMFAQMPGVTIKFLQIYLPWFDPWVSRLVIAPFPLTSSANGYITLYVIKEYRRKVKKLFGKEQVVPSGAAAPGRG